MKYNKEPTLLETWKHGITALSARASNTGLELVEEETGTERDAGIFSKFSDIYIYI
jgi:hypothetical protein